MMDVDKTVTCFVPSEEGKKFTIHAKNDHDQIVSLQLEFDGVSSTCLAVNPGQTREKWGVRTGPTSRQPFQFSKLTVTDSDEAALQPHDYANLSTIKAIAKRIRWELGQPPQLFNTFKATDTVHERSKKAGVHCVALGAPSTVEPRAANQRSVYLDQHPIATFIFQYRPLALLQAEGIIPLQSRPQPGPSRHLAQSVQGQMNHAAGSSRPAKRARTGSEEGDVKPAEMDVDTSSDEDSELNALKASANALQGQLQDIMSRIERVERKRPRTGRAARSGGARKKEEPSDRGLMMGEIVDLTMSD